MRVRSFNWPIWLGFLLSLIAFFSYPFVFVRFPVTRDFPWVNLLLFALAAVLLLVGLRRAFSTGRTHPTRSRIGGVILATLSVAVLGFFVFTVFIGARRLPQSHGAPQVGQKAPDFTLPDTSNRPVSLSELLSSPVNEETANADARSPADQDSRKTPKGVLLIFYRGYW